MTIRWGKPVSDKALRDVERQYREWIRSEVRPRIDQGMSFDDAWKASGGEVHTDAALALAAAAMSGRLQ